MENGSNKCEINASGTYLWRGVNDDFYPGTKADGNILEIILNGLVPSIPGFL